MANQDKLKSLINKINWLYKSFEDNNFDNVSSLEKALIKEQVLMFYDEIKKLETKAPKERFPSVTPERVITPKTNVIGEEIKEKVLAETKYIESEITAEAVENSELNQVIEEVKEEPIVEKIVEPIFEEIFAPVVEVPKVEVKKEIIQETKQEKFEKTVEFQRQIAMPKRDMREIIDLNKSFIFKAELFNQNSDIYNQFINEINSTRTEDEALTFVIDWTGKMDWETEENKAYDLLLKAIEKRFLPLI